MNITQEKLAQKINVTSRTLRNWEKEKPELIRLIRLGLKSDNSYKDFFMLFETNKFWRMPPYYLDFYFRFLNYFRKNITLKNNHVNYMNKDITSTVITYLIEKHKSEIFDKRFIGNEMIDMGDFKEEAFRKPLFEVSEELSIYILKNTLDGFGLLVNDTLYKNKIFFEDSLKISIIYLVHMFYPLTNYKEKEKITRDIFENDLNSNIYSFKDEPNRETDNEKIYRSYLKFKKKLFSENLDKLSNEWESYSDNDFYVPQLIEEIEKEITK